MILGYVECAAERRHALETRRGGTLPVGLSR